jgi:hypothetical protein
MYSHSYNYSYSSTDTSQRLRGIGLLQLYSNPVLRSPNISNFCRSIGSASQINEVLRSRVETMRILYPKGMPREIEVSWDPNEDLTELVHNLMRPEAEWTADARSFMQLARGMGRDATEAVTILEDWGNSAFPSLKGAYLDQYQARIWEVLSVAAKDVRDRWVPEADAADQHAPLHELAALLEATEELPRRLLRQSSASWCQPCLRGPLALTATANRNIVVEGKVTTHLHTDTYSRIGIWEPRLPLPSRTNRFFFKKGPEATHSDLDDETDSDEYEETDSEDMASDVVTGWIDDLGDLAQALGSACLRNELVGNSNPEGTAPGQNEEISTTRLPVMEIYSPIPADAHEYASEYDDLFDEVRKRMDPRCPAVWSGGIVFGSLEVAPCCPCGQGDTTKVEKGSQSLSPTEWVYTWTSPQQDIEPQ